MTVPSRALRRVQRLAIQAWFKAQPRFGVATRSGRILVPGTPGTGWVLSWRRDWKADLIDRCLRSHPGLFVDVGANIGQTLLDYCNASNRQGYVGFEPSPRCVEHLRAMVAINGLADCTIVPVALSDDNAVLSFFARDAADPGATLIGEIDPLKPVVRSLVPAYRLDDILEETIGAAAISLMKIDVEGAEGAVLDGMTRLLTERRPLITCEVLNRVPAADPEEHRRRNARLRARLRAAGYDLHRILKAPGSHALAGLERVDDFPEAVVTPENAHLCDYLFVPSERTISLP